MKFEIKLNLIKSYLKKLTISVQSVSSRVEFTGVLITVFDNSITFEGRNDYMDSKIEESSLIDVKIMEPGRALIKANTLNEIIQKMEGDTVIFNKIDSNIVSIESKDSSYKMNLLDDKNYDRASFMSETEEGISIPADKFYNSVSKVVFAGNDLHPKFIYQGLNIKIDNGIMKTTVCDGVRIASYKSNVGVKTNINKIVPLKVVKELIRILPSKDEYKFFFKKDRGIVITENMVNQFQLIEGSYPTFDKFFDEGIYNKKLNINKDIIDNAIERSAIMILNKTNPSNRISMDISTNEFIIESREIEAGSAKVQIKNFSYEGDPINISLSPKIIQDGLKATNLEKINLYFTDNKSSVLMKNEEGLIYLLSPMI